MVAFLNLTEQIDTPVSVRPKPFIKWAGGKAQLLGQLTPLLPAQFATYFEPFVGSAALYWHIYRLREKGLVCFRKVFLSDRNPELINTYLVVRDDVNALCDHLMSHRNNHCREYYYKMRDLDISNLTPLERAARFIYLNKTCFNGLYRVNRSGHFNVPMGSYKNPMIFDTNTLLQASKALQGSEIAVTGFRSVLGQAKRDDFVYLDPPYVPLSKTSSFTGYTDAAFGPEEQQELAIVYQQLHIRGCKVMLSNSWTETTIQLYRDFKIVQVQASRAINSNPNGRGRIDEMVVLNYEPGP
jgi:DNA adenine methylase